jgi:hypothetical protein
VAIVSREMARRFWPGEDPLGRQIRMSDAVDTIVGIVGIAADVRSESFAGPPQPEMYRPYAQTRDRTFAFMIRSDREGGQVLRDARAVVQQFDGKLPLIGPSTMAQLVDAALAQPRFYLLLASMFAVLALVLAAVGIYGVVSYVVGQRTREIGVRMALGAQGREVVGLVLWQGLWPALVGGGIGMAVSVAGASAIEKLLYEIASRDAATMAGVMILLLVVVVAACLVPAVRATRIAPVDALKVP